MYCISFLFLVLKKLIEFKHVREVFIIKKNKQIQIYKNIYTLLLKLTDICAPAESQKGQQKVPVLKQTTELCPTRSYYSMDYSIYTLIVQVIPEPRCLDCLYYIIL